MRHRLLNLVLCAAAAGGLATSATADKPDFPPFEKVSEGFTKVVSTTDGEKPLYTIWINEKTGDMLAELPRGWERQKYYFAVTQASGAIFAGLQGPTRYVYWRQYDKRLALIEPEISTRSTGEAESKMSVERLFTDRVLTDVPIVTMGPGHQPVIDLDELLVGHASTFLGGRVRGVNARLAKIVKAKAFPENIEIAIEVPVAGGTLTTFHYSISQIPEKTGYKPRKADERVGYFTTVYRDLGEYDNKKKWVRYINRWHLEKRDPKLKLSPPKEPIVFYVEHTVPVRYRRWVREGVEYWNDAFRAIGIDNAIEVHYQDKATGAHMDKDPEDVRYNFLRWLNNDISTAIGPSRAHPLTGQILDADIILTDGWIRAFWTQYTEQAPELAVEGMTEETLEWLEDFPQWDPRLLLATPKQKERILAIRRERDRLLAEGEDVSHLPNDTALVLNEELAEIHNWLGDSHQECLCAHHRAADMSFAYLTLQSMGMIKNMSENGAGDTLDGIPDWFVGPLVADLVCHEVGHTLGLRHNFKASSIYSLAEINSDEIKGKKPFTGSVMDYNPVNFNMEAGEEQGDFAMIGIGPYDKWAIEYGYTFDDPKKVLERVAEPELVYLTDDDTRGPDPLAKTYDFSSDPLDYAENQMRLVRYHRGRLLDEFVKDGESWANARRGYQATLSMQIRMVSMMANWVGGAHVSRARKGDPNAGPPVTVVDQDQQRAALQFVIDNAFNDDAFGLSPELLSHMTVDKWSDRSPGDRGSPAWEVHDRIRGVQAASLSMLMNPSTLQRVYDNELRTPAEEDALTLPELMDTLISTIFAELATVPNEDFDEREPMISSLRRNLQSEAMGRLIFLATDGRGMPDATRTLARMHLRELAERIDSLLEKSNRRYLDDYTAAHLMDLQQRIDTAMKAIQITPNR
jgi:hypothetical protein